MVDGKLTIRFPTALGGMSIDVNRRVYSDLIKSSQLRKYGRILIGENIYMASVDEAGKPDTTPDGFVEYVAEGDYIPIEDWGHDHWERFVYFQHVILDWGGILDNNKMRCDPRLHSRFANALSMLTRPTDQHGIPTVLRDGLPPRHNHDDWSILEDMIAAGLIGGVYRVKEGQIFGGGKAHIMFTSWGWDVVAQLHDYFSIHLTRKGFLPKKGSDHG